MLLISFSVRSFAEVNSAFNSPLLTEHVSTKLYRILSKKKNLLLDIKKLKNFVNNSFNLYCSEILLRAFNWSSLLFVGSLIRDLKSSLEAIKLMIEAE